MGIQFGKQLFFVEDNSRVKVFVCVSDPFFFILPPFSVWKIAAARTYFSFVYVSFIAPG